MLDRFLSEKSSGSQAELRLPGKSLAGMWAVNLAALLAGYLEKQLVATKDCLLAAVRADWKVP